MSNSWTVAGIARGVQDGQMTAKQVTDMAVQLVGERDRGLRAVRQVQAEQAGADSARLDTLTADERRSLPLCGVPVLIKDNIAQAKQPLAAGRPDGAGEVAEGDALVVERLREAGAVIIGRANMDELAYGVTGSNEHTGQVRNPWDKTRHPGGSSAGPGAAVAAGIVPASVGTDTGGSVRIPASVCGLVGIRPSHGLVPTTGVAPLSRSLDTVGPLATTVQDVALMLAVMSGEMSLGTEMSSDPGALKGRSLVALGGTFALEPDPRIAGLLESMLEKLEGAGAAVERADVPELRQGPRASGPIIGAEASYAWSKQLEEQPTWFGGQVAELVEKGTGIKAVRLLRAQDEAERVVEAVDALFREGAWGLVLPTVARVTSRVDAIGSQLDMLALTAPFSLGGWPSASVPMGQVEGLPVGLQVVCPRGEDRRVLELAAAVERLQPWTRTAPPMS